MTNNARFTFTIGVTLPHTGYAKVIRVPRVNFILFEMRTLDLSNLVHKILFTIEPLKPRMLDTDGLST